jgi:RNA polymerase sigma factor (sigma-70 family)
MRRIGFGPHGMVGFGTSSSQDDKSSAEFEELAMPLFDSLYNFARWLVHKQNDAEDLVQETYLKALHSFASFQRGTTFRAWMFRILKNTFLSSCSKLERRITVAMDAEEVGVMVTPFDLKTALLAKHAKQAAPRIPGSRTARGPRVANRRLQTW